MPRLQSVPSTDALQVFPLDDIQRTALAVALNQRAQAEALILKIRTAAGVPDTLPVSVSEQGFVEVRDGN